MNGLTLAYIGDAYYELCVRKHFVDKGFTNVGMLHKAASKCTSGVAQSQAMYHLLNEKVLSENEISLYKRGRNAHVNTKRKIDLNTYQQATGFEALIGYLSIYDQNRCDTLIAIAIDYLMKNGGQSNG